MTRLLAHSIWLPLVLCHARVNGPVALSAIAVSSPYLISSYCTMSGRIGALKTLGRWCVSLPGEPSAPCTVTVGRLVIVPAVMPCCVDGTVVHKVREVQWSSGFEISAPSLSEVLALVTLGNSFVSINSEACLLDLPIRFRAHCLWSGHPVMSNYH